MLNLQDLRDQFYRVAGEDHDPRDNADEFINDAGSHLFTMHSWQWRLPPPALLDFVADQPYLTLPPDFGGAGEVLRVSSDDLTKAVGMVSLEKVAAYRSESVASATHYWVALAFPGQATTRDSASLPQLSIYPTPASNDTGAVRMTYRRGWTRLTQPKSAANIPDTMDRLMTQLVRAYANYAKTNDRSMLDKIEASPELGRMKQADGSQQAHIGRVSGGQMDVDPAVSRDPLSNWQVVEGSYIA